MTDDKIKCDHLNVYQPYEYPKFTDREKWIAQQAFEAGRAYEASLHADARPDGDLMR